MPKYVIITPVRDEATHIGRTIKSVTSQTITPMQWIIVDDGSEDGTGHMIEESARLHPWIRSVRRTNRGYRNAGGGVIDAFYDGYGHLSASDWGFIVKLDGDLSFDADYFESCFNRFSTEPDLGIGGGFICDVTGNGLATEKYPLFHVRGATKIYKKECWDAIGGLLRAPGWDTLDEVKANMLGWKTRTFIDLKVIHHRPTGAADGTWPSSVKYGLANYISGYHPLFLLVKCLKRVVEKPYMLGSIGLLYGFALGFLKKVPQVDDPALIRYLRKQQIRRLLLKSSLWS